MAYCTTTDIQAKIPYTTFSATSKPTLTQVSDYCDDISADMDEKFQSVGVTVPVTDSDKLKLLTRVACFGVVAEVYRSQDNNIEKAKMYQDLYDKEMKYILANPDILLATAEVTNAPQFTQTDSTRTVPFARETDGW